MTSKCNFSAIVLCVCVATGTATTWATVYGMGMVGFRNLLQPMQNFIVSDLVIEARKSLSIGDFSGLKEKAQKVGKDSHQSIAYIIKDSNGKLVAYQDLENRNYTNSITAEIQAKGSNATDLLLTPIEAKVDRSIGTITVYFYYPRTLLTYWPYVTTLITLLILLTCVLTIRAHKAKRLATKFLDLAADNERLNKELDESNSRIENIFETLVLTLQNPVEILTKTTTKNELSALLIKRLLDNLSLILSIPKPTIEKDNFKCQITVFTLGNCNGLRGICLALKFKNVKVVPIWTENDKEIMEFHSGNLTAILDLDPLANDSSQIEKMLLKLPNNVYVLGLCPSDYEDFQEINDVTLDRINWTIKSPFNSNEVLRTLINRPSSLSLI